MSRQVLEVRVECYAGYRGEQEPRAFHIGSRRVEAVDIIDRWLAPDHRYFKVRGEDGDLYILRHNPDQDVWEVIFCLHESSATHPVPGKR